MSFSAVNRKPRSAGNPPRPTVGSCVNLTAPLNINWLWAEVLVEELRRHGVGMFFCAPGSRAAPLLSAIGRHAGVSAQVHVDERALAFSAMGWVAGSGRPAALVCTSGTAAANFLPALVEASKKKLPLVVLTADRPPELQKTGAPQTIEQQGLYGPYVRWTADIPCPSREIPLRYLLTTAAEAVNRACGEVPGPVHLNMMFRDPLGPVRSGIGLLRYAAPLKAWLAAQRPHTALAPRAAGLTLAAATDIRVRLRGIRRGVIFAGKLSTDEDRRSVLALARRTGFPVLADITSGLRLGGGHEEVIAHYALALEALPGLSVDGVIHCGGRMTDRQAETLCARSRLKEYMMVPSHPLRSDPFHRVTCRAAVSPAAFVQAVLDGLDVRKDTVLLAAMKREERRIAGRLDRDLERKGLTGPRVARLVSRLIPEGEALFLSNSLPVREMDRFAAADGRPVAVGANRGASGIDGILASAAGFALGRRSPATVMIGDLAFFYDLNALAMLRGNHAPRLVVLLLNNNGGGIFSRLPSSRESRPVFERFFLAPHGLRARQAAALFGLSYEAPQDMGGLLRAYRRALARPRSTVIELVIPREG